jgi:hypothetical protein
MLLRQNFVAIARDSGCALPQHLKYRNQQNTQTSYGKEYLDERKTSVLFHV